MENPPDPKFPTATAPHPFPSEVRWPRVRSDKAEPILLPLLSPEGDSTPWQVKKAPWWLDARITGGVLVLQVRNCGKFAARLVLEGPQGKISLPVRADVFPRTNQALLHTVWGLGTTFLGGIITVASLYFTYYLAHPPPTHHMGPAQALTAGVAQWLCFAFAGLVWGLGSGKEATQRSALGAGHGSLVLFGFQMLRDFEVPVHEFPGEPELLLCLGTLLTVLTWASVTGGRHLAAWAGGAAALAGLLTWIIYQDSAFSFYVLPPLLPVMAMLAAGAGAAGRLAPRKVLPAEAVLQDRVGTPASSF